MHKNELIHNLKEYVFTNDQKSLDSEISASADNLLSFISLLIEADKKANECKSFRNTNCFSKTE